jgi:hypothetical protein
MLGDFVGQFRRFSKTFLVAFHTRRGTPCLAYIHMYLKEKLNKFVPSRVLTSSQGDKIGRIFLRFRDCLLWVVLFENDKSILKLGYFLTR